MHTRTMHTVCTYAYLTAVARGEAGPVVLPVCTAARADALRRAAVFATEELFVGALPPVAGPGAAMLAVKEI